MGNIHTVGPNEALIVSGESLFVRQKSNFRSGRKKKFSRQRFAIVLLATRNEAANGENKVMNIR